MAITAADLARLDSGAHGFGPVVVNAVPLTVVASAQINQGSFTYPLVEITVDNTSADWVAEGQVGRMVMIGTAPSLHDVTWGVCRLPSTSTKLYLDAKEVGEPGFARDIQVELENDLYISIVKYRPPWGLLSSIRSGVFYKRWDVAYVDQGKNPDPIVRMGQHRTGFVDASTGLLRLTFTVDPYFFAGRSLDSVLWAIDAGTLVGGYVLTDTTIEVDFEAGFNEVTCTVTDTKGKSRQGYRYVWANSRDRASSDAPFSYRHTLSAGSLPQKPEGCDGSLTFEGAFDPDDFFPGQMFIVTEYADWNHQALDDPDVVAGPFVVYAGEQTVSTGRGVRRVTVPVSSPVVIAPRVPVPVQAMQEKTNPKRWTEVTSTLSNPVGAFYYLAAHHAPYLIDGHDVDFDETLLTYRRRIFTFQTKTLGEQMRELGLLFLGNVGSNGRGTTRLLRNPFYFTNDERNALDDKFIWQPRHLADVIDFPIIYWPVVGQTFGYAFSYHGGQVPEAFASLAPGYAQSQSGGQMSMTPFTVPWQGTHELTQDLVNQWTGMHHAIQNSRSQNYTFPVLGNLDVAEPCDLDQWHNFSAGGYYDPYGIGYSERALPVQVQREWAGPGGQRKTLRIEFQGDTYGFPGVTVPVNKGGAATWLNRVWVPGQFDPYLPRVPNLNLSIPAFYAFNDLRYMGRSFNFGESNVTWDLQDTIVVDVAINTYSDYFTVGTTEPLEVAVLEYNESTGTLALYSMDDLFADTPVFTLLESWSSVSPGASFRDFARILIDLSLTDYWVVAWKAQDGVTFDRSRDGGASWDGRTYIGSSSPVDTDTINEPLGIALDNGRCIVTARDGTTDVDGDFNYFVYHSANSTASFSKISNPTDWVVQQSALALRGTGASTGIVPLRKKASPTPTNTLDIVDFDGSYPDYTVSTTGDSSGVGTDPTFYPAQNNLAYGLNTTPTDNDQVDVTVTIDLEAPYTFSEVSFWAVANASNVTNRYKLWTVELFDQGDNTIVSRTFSEAVPLAWPAATYTVTAADLNYDAETDVYKVQITFIMSWDVWITGSMYAYLDDIDITADLVSYDETRALYSLAVPTGVYTQRDSNQILPNDTYGIAVDSSDSTHLMVVGSNEKGDRVVLLESTDSGISWAKVRSVPGYTGVKVSGDIVILWGYNRLQASNDGGATSYDMLGDWVARLGAVARIRGVGGVF